MIIFFFYNQQAFVFHLFGDFCNIHDHIVAFLFIFRKVLISFTFCFGFSFFFLFFFFSVFFLYFLDNIFCHFYIYENKNKKMKILEMHLLKDLKIWLWNFNFGMIYIIKKMLLLLKNHLNYLSTFEFFLRSIIHFSFFLFLN